MNATTQQAPWAHTRPQRVVVGLSGGVDSAVSAWLLKQAGHEVIGIFMKNWEGDDDSEYCSSRQDFVDAAAVADVIGIEIEHVNFAAEYRDRVFATFLREYAAGRTPNPDVLCNSEIKFAAFLDHALRLGAERIATGHYARNRLASAGGALQLLKGLDPGKDQSYFLHRLNQRQIAPVWFPVGEWPKREVRRIAAEVGLPNASKKDSTGICFIGERPFREFLQRYIAHQPGPMRNDQGQVVGQHLGLSFYTLGQRQGLGLGGINPAHLAQAQRRSGAQPASPPSPSPAPALPAEAGVNAPWYVARKDLGSNTLWVVQGHDHPWLLSQRLHAIEASWLAGSAPPPGRYAAKTRYRQADAACTLESVDADGAITLHFDQPQWAVTPGQSVVLYAGEVCLGGALISTAQ